MGLSCLVFLLAKDQYPPSLHPSGYGRAGREGACEGNWHLKLHHHKDRTSAPDSQDSTCCEPGGVSPLLPATETEGVL